MNAFRFISEPQVHRIETKQAPKPSQPEVVLSDGKCFRILAEIFNILCLFFVLNTDRELSVRVLFNNNNNRNLVN